MAKFICRNVEVFLRELAWRVLEAEFFSSPISKRRRFVFRGQGNIEWPLETTLERFCLAHGLSKETAEGQLLAEFTAEGIGYNDRLRQISKKEQMLLARHHGSPSSFMEWTASPYVAALFTFANPVHDASPEPRRISIFRVNLVQRDVSESLEVWHESDLTWPNTRAHE